MKSQGRNEKIMFCVIKKKKRPTPELWGILLRLFQQEKSGFHNCVDPSLGDGLALILQW